MQWHCSRSLLLCNCLDKLQGRLSTSVCGSFVYLFRVLAGWTARKTRIVRSGCSSLTSTSGVRKAVGVSPAKWCNNSGSGVERLRETTTRPARLAGIAQWQAGRDWVTGLLPLAEPPHVSHICGKRNKACIPPRSGGSQLTGGESLALARCTPCGKSLAARPALIRQRARAWSHPFEVVADWCGWLQAQASLVAAVRSTTAGREDVEADTDWFPRGASFLLKAATIASAQPFSEYPQVWRPNINISSGRQEHELVRVNTSVLNNTTAIWKAKRSALMFSLRDRKQQQQIRTLVQPQKHHEV